MHINVGGTGFAVFSKNLRDHTAPASSRVFLEFLAMPNAIRRVSKTTTMPRRDTTAVTARPASTPPHRLRKTHKLEHRPPFDSVALLLQGGGALGAYQAGVYEALAEANLHPDWVAGISIGGINSAIIAGNPREARVAKLREFWELVSQSPFGLDGNLASLLPRGDAGRALAQHMSVSTASVLGVPGFYTMRFPSPLFQPQGTIEATSFCDTTPLKPTLERLVDFDLINSENHNTRLSLGSVNARSGQLVYFDTTTDVIRAEHVMASGALPPGFPAIEIDGELLLGWRRRLQHAFGVDSETAPAKHARLSGGPMGRARPVSEKSPGSHDTDEGDSEFEPYCLPHQRLQGA
jgi:predicted acylesterase/phospholipase RssA